MTGDPLFFFLFSSNPVKQPPTSHPSCCETHNPVFYTPAIDEITLVCTTQTIPGVLSSILNQFRRDADKHPLADLIHKKRDTRCREIQFFAVFVCLDFRALTLANALMAHGRGEIATRLGQTNS